MTNEERQKLCAGLRAQKVGGWFSFSSEEFMPMGEVAANEIERLATDVEHWMMIANRAYIDPKPLAQSDTERGRGDFAKYAEQFNIEQNIKKLKDDGWRLPVNAAEPVMEQGMTNEERQELCVNLRRPSFHIRWFILQQAANEIERLTKELEEAKRHDMRDERTQYD
jgi:hypothetical protein